MFEKGGASRQPFRTIHLPPEDTDRELECLASGHSAFRLRHRSGRQLGHLAAEPSSTTDKPKGHPPPPQLLGEGTPGSGARLPARQPASPVHVSE